MITCVTFSPLSLSNSNLQLGLDTLKFFRSYNINNMPVLGAYFLEIHSLVKLYTT